LGAIFSQKSFLWVTLEHLPKKKSKGGVASRNVTKTQYEDFLMNSVAQGYGTIIFHSQTSVIFIILFQIFSI
jgi:hypothetical protein